MTRLFTLFQFLDATCDGFDGATDAFLDEVGGEVGFLSQLVVQGVFCFRLAGDAVVVVAPRPLAGAVGAVQELLLGLMEVATTLFGYVEFDGYGASWRVVHL